MNHNWEELLSTLYTMRLQSEKPHSPAQYGRKGFGSITASIMQLGYILGKSLQDCRKNDNCSSYVRLFTEKNHNVKSTQKGPSRAELRRKLRI